MFVLPKQRWPLALALGLALVVIAVALAKHRAGYLSQFWSGDAQYDAVVAKHMLAGEGVSTNLMPLGGLRTVVNRGWVEMDPWPSVHKFVLSQARVAAFLLFIKDAELATRVASFVPYCLTALILYGALTLAWGDAVLGFVLALGFLSFNDLASISVSGLALTGDGFLFTAAAAVFVVTRHRPKWAVPLGLLLGASVLHRYSMLLSLPFWWLAVRRWTTPATARMTMAACLVVIVPFIAWSLVKYHMLFPSYLGDSFFLHRTPYLENDPWYVMSWPSLKLVVTHDPGALASKWLRNTVEFARSFASNVPDAIRNATVVGLTVVGLVRLRGTHCRPVLLPLMAFVGAYGAFHMFLSATYAYFIFLLPVVWAIAAFGLSELLKRRYPRHARLAMIGVVVLLAAPEVPKELAQERACRQSLRDNVCPGDRYCARSEVLSFLREHYPRRGLILAAGDRPWELSDTEHRVIPIPESPEALSLMQRQGIRLSVLFLPVPMTFAGDGKRPMGWVTWQSIAKARPASFGDYRLRHVFSDGSVLYERGAEDNLQEKQLDYCSFTTRIDLAADDLKIWSPTGFRYRELGTSGSSGWSWVQGNVGSVLLVGCAKLRRARITYLTGTPRDVIITVNDRAVGVLPKRYEVGFGTVEVDLEPGAFRDGVNRMTFTSEDLNKYGLSLALSRIELE